MDRERGDDFDSDHDIQECVVYGAGYENDNHAEDIAGPK